MFTNKRMLTQSLEQNRSSSIILTIKLKITTYHQNYNEDLELNL